MVSKGSTETDKLNISKSKESLKQQQQTPPAKGHRDQGIMGL